MLLLLINCTSDLSAVQTYLLWTGDRFHVKGVVVVLLEGARGGGGALLQGQLLQEESHAVPQVVTLAQVLHDGWPDGDGRLALGEGLREGVEGRRVAVLLYDMRPGAQEGDDLTGNALQTMARGKNSKNKSLKTIERKKL